MRFLSHSGASGGTCAAPVRDQGGGGGSRIRTSVFTMSPHTILRVLGVLLMYSHNKVRIVQIESTPRGQVANHGSNHAHGLAGSSPATAVKPERNGVKS